MKHLTTRISKVNSLPMDVRNRLLIIIHISIKRLHNMPMGHLLQWVNLFKCYKIFDTYLEQPHSFQTPSIPQKCLHRYIEPKMLTNCGSKSYAL